MIQYRRIEDGSNMRKIVLLIIVLFIFPVVTLAFVKPSQLLYVTDEANLLKESTEEYIIRYSDFLSKKKKIHYYVVTVPSLENYTIDAYSEYVFQSFHVGERGILIFATEDEKMVQVILGSKLSSLMDEKEIEAYINQYIMSYLKNGEWDKGIKNGYSAFYKKICSHYRIDASSMILLDGKEFLTRYRTPTIMAIIVLGMFFSYTFCQFFQKKYRRKHLRASTYLSFAGALLLNIILLGISYFLQPFFLILLLGVEFLVVTTTFGSSNMSLEEAFMKIKQEESRKKKKRYPIRKKNKK